MRTAQRAYIFGLLLLLVLSACRREKEHTAPAINDKDSVAMLTSYGVNTLISDSGVIKYRVVTEKWEVNQTRNPSRWIFEKGLLLTQFNEDMHIHSYISSDTAYYFDRDRLWEMHGRVNIYTKEGLDFKSEQLYWDEMHNDMWSNRYSHLVSPERELRGSKFTASVQNNGELTAYEVHNASGWFMSGDYHKDTPRTPVAPPATPPTTEPQDTTKLKVEK